MVYLLSLPPLFSALTLQWMSSPELSWRHIPDSHVRGYIPSFSSEIRGLVREQNRLRSVIPSPLFLERIEHSSELWTGVVDSINHRTTPSKIWKVVCSLKNSNSDIPAGHEAIFTTGFTLIPSSREQANLLVVHYASISGLPHVREERRIKAKASWVSI